MEISQELLDQYEEVRAGGQANMFDRHAVAVAANELGLFQLVVCAADRAGFGILLKEVSRRSRGSATP